MKAFNKLKRISSQFLKFNIKNIEKINTITNSKVYCGLSQNQLKHFSTNNKNKINDDINNNTNNNTENNINSQSEPNTTNNKYDSEIINLLFENNIQHKKVPCFEVFSSQIEILQRPFDFYLAIIVII